MKAVLDIILICAVIICVYMGYKKGFVKSVMSLLSFVIAFYTAQKFSPPLSSYLYSNWIKPNFAAAISNQIENFLSPSVSLDRLVQDQEPGFVGMIEGYGVKLPDVSKWLNDAVSGGVADLKKYVAENLAEPVAAGISDFLAFAAVFTASLILLKILTALINKAVKLPGLNMLNKIGGTIVGCFYGFAFCCIFVLLVYFALPFLAANTPPIVTREIIDETIFFKWFLTNPLFNII